MTTIGLKQSIIINENDFERGITSSSSKGIQLMKNVDPINIAGNLQAGFELMNGIPDHNAPTFTANDATDVITVASTFDYVRQGITFTSTGRVVQLFTTGTLPAGLTTSTNFYIIKVTATTIKLATTLANAIAGTPIDITSAGTGTHTISGVKPRRFEHYAMNSIVGTIDAADQVFAQDNTGKVWQYRATYGWQLLEGNTPDGTVGAGLVVWKNYLFSFKQNSVDVYGPLDSSPSWTNSWSGVTNLGTGSNAPLDKTYHKAIVGQDDIVYFINANANVPYVGSLLEVPGQTFAPASGATYNWNGRALDFPSLRFITDLEELGYNLMVSTVDRYIYPWDKRSPSFDLPIATAEPFITAMKTVNNILYYACGTRGNIYKTVGTTSVQVLDFSDQLSNVPQTAMRIDDLEVYESKLLFSSSGSNPGLYMIDLETGKYNLMNTLTNSTGIPTTIFTQNNPSLYSLNYVVKRLFVSWADTVDPLVGTVWGCDSNFLMTNGPYRATGDISSFISENYLVGEPKNRRNFEQIELILMNAITSGHSVKISSRVDNETAFSNEVTFSYASMSSMGFQTGYDLANIQNATTIQFKVIISLPANTSGATSQYVTPIIRQIKIS